MERIGKTKYLVIILPSSPNQTAPYFFFSNAQKLEKPEIRHHLMCYYMLCYFIEKIICCADSPFLSPRIEVQEAKTWKIFIWAIFFLAEILCWRSVTRSNGWLGCFILAEITELSLDLVMVFKLILKEFSSTYWLWIGPIRDDCWWVPWFM